MLTDFERQVAEWPADPEAACVRLRERFQGWDVEYVPPRNGAPGVFQAVKAHGNQKWSGTHSLDPASLAWAMGIIDEAGPWV